MLISEVFCARWRNLRDLHARYAQIGATFSPTAASMCDAREVFPSSGLVARDQKVVQIAQETLMKYTLLTCGLMVAISAFAEPGEGNGAKAFRTLDVDGDKMVSLAEAEQGAPHVASRFAKLDTNNDGLLSREEMAVGRPAHGVRIMRSIDEDFAAADGNADGRLSRAEAEETMPIVSDFFDEMDANTDGYVAMEEIHAHAKSHGPIVKHIAFERDSMEFEE